jgi:hypothetical protein
LFIARLMAISPPMATINMRSRTTDYTAMARVAQKWLQLKKYWYYRFQSYCMRLQIKFRIRWSTLISIQKYYTLRFYFPYLSLLAQPVIIFVYGPVTILVYGPARYLHHNIVLDSTNSSWYWGSYGSIWIGLSPKKYYMDRSAAEVHIIFFWWLTAIFPRDFLYPGTKLSEFIPI